MGPGPEADERAAQLSASGALVRRAGAALDPALLDDALLVCVCAAVAEPDAVRLAHEARARGALVVCSDRPSLSDFAHPAVVRRGRVSIAISTSGASPALSRRLRELLDALVPARLAVFAERLAELRARVAGLPLDERMARLSAPVKAVLLHGRLELPELAETDDDEAV